MIEDACTIHMKISLLSIIRNVVKNVSQSCFGEMDVYFEYFEKDEECFGNFVKVLESFVEFPKFVYSQ